MHASPGVRSPVRHRPLSAPLTHGTHGVGVRDHDPARVWDVTRTVRTRSSVFRSVREPFGDVRERERTLAEPPFFLGCPHSPLLLGARTPGVNKARQAMLPSRRRWALLPKSGRAWVGLNARSVGIDPRGVRKPFVLRSRTRTNA